MTAPPAFAWGVSHAAELANETTQSPVPIGFIVLAIIIAPVIIFSLAAVFGHPRQYRVPGLFVASVILLMSAMVAGFATMGIVLQLFVPR